MSDETLKPCPFCGGEAECEMHFTHKIFRVTCAGSQCYIIQRTVWHTTEAEAIAAWNNRATMGDDASATRLADRLHGIAEEMRNIGASTMTPHELFRYFAREIDKAVDIAATLGSEPPYDEWKIKCETLEFAYKQADAERKRYSEQIDELLAERDEWKAKLDDLNAELGSGECENVSDDVSFTCSACGSECYIDWTGSGCGTPRFCPNCGRAVKR